MDRGVNNNLILSKDPLVISVSGLGGHIVLVLHLIQRGHLILEVIWDRHRSSQLTSGRNKGLVEAEVVSSLIQPPLDAFESCNLLIKAEVISPLLGLIQLLLLGCFQVGVLFLKKLYFGPKAIDLLLGILKLVVKPRGDQVGIVKLLPLFLECILELVLLQLELLESLILGPGDNHSPVVQDHELLSSLQKEENNSK